MNQYKKAVDFKKAMNEKCYWCISREYHYFDCQFNQGTYFSYPCSQEDYKTCPAWGCLMLDKLKSIPRRIIGGIFRYARFYRN